jgi:putative membrane protein
MDSRLSRFLVRWFVSGFGLFIAVALLGNESLSYGESFMTIVASGFFIAIVNTFIRPLVVFLTLPAVLVTLGIFMLVINALMIQLAAWLYEPLFVDGFGIALLTGAIIGIVNWLVSVLLEDKKV